MGENMAAESPGEEDEELKEKLRNTAERWKVLTEVITKKVKCVEEVVILVEKIEQEIEVVITFITTATKTLQNVKPVSSDLEPIKEEHEKVKVMLIP